MDYVGNEVYVALPSSSSSIYAERLLHRKTEKQQFNVMDIELVGRFPLPCAFLEVRVVSEKQQ